MKQPISLLLELEEINMLACYASEEAVDTHKTTLLRIGEIARNAAISLQKCEPMAQVEEGKYLVGFGRKETRKFVVFDQTLPVGTKLYTTPPVVPQGEPVAWAHPSGGYLSARYMKEFATGLEKETYTIPLYAAPVRTKDLTVDEKVALADRLNLNGRIVVIDAVIAAYKEKNK
jgi:hypothetical protein